MKDDKRNTQEENQSQLRKVSRKRWFYPAIYLCVAALVMSGVLVMEKGSNGSHPNATSKKPTTNQVASNNQTAANQAAVPANTTQKEVLQWPVSDPSQVTIGQKFYNPNGSQAEQVAALVNYDNSYAPNTGINLVANDKKSFDVTAALSGTVTLAQKDPLLGYKVEVQNNNGVSTLYESLAAIDVQKGDQVHQGQLIGQAGTDKYNTAMGTHLHFEIRKDSIPVDPTAYWDKATTAVSSKPSKSKSSNQSKSNNQSGNSTQSGDKSSDQSNGNSNNNMNSGSSSSAQDSSNSGATSSTSNPANSGITNSGN